MTAEVSRQHIDWLRREAKKLAQGVCPYSGLPLTTHGDGRPGSLSCGVCDCHGYPAEERK